MEKSFKAKAAVPQASKPAVATNAPESRRWGTTARAQVIGACIAAAATIIVGLVNSREPVTVNVENQVNTNVPVAPKTAASAIGRDTRRAAANVSAGKKIADSGDIAGAYDTYTRATQLDPSNAYAWANLGAAAAKLGKPEEATQAYETALRLDPENWLAHYNLSCQFAYGGNHDAALQHLSRAITCLRKRARSNTEFDSLVMQIKMDDAFRELRNDHRFAALMAAAK